MAVDQTLKLEIRAVYESNSLSVKKVLERFPQSDVSPKTVESWVKKEKWIKNRFVNEKEAIDKLVEQTLPLADAKEVVKAKLVDDKDGNIMPPEEKDQYAGLVGRELAYKVLHQNQLQVMMAENLVRSERYAVNARNIGTVATHHNLLTTTFKTLYGEIKHITPYNPDAEIYTDEELDDKTIEELDKLLE